LELNITSIFLEGGNPELQDRVEILRFEDRPVFLLADGAGGISGGAQAADCFIRASKEAAPGLTNAEQCRQLLQTIDQNIADANDCGETTGVVVLVRPDSLFGAQVGDSAAWLFSSGGKRELTSGRARKPFLGTGGAFPHLFVQQAPQGTLVVASDGLWKYTSLELIEQKVGSVAAENLATELASLVRLRSGAFPDDIAIATCRLEP
jgi:serine/threonine protein phosphatase PrpC